MLLSLLVDAGPNVGITAPCGTDVVDVSVTELEDSDRHVVLRAAFYSFAIFDE